MKLTGRQTVAPSPDAPLIVSAAAMNRERLVDEMALVLMNVVELNSDDACTMALLAEGFRGKDIAVHLDEARTLAREANTPTREFWITRQWR